MMGSEKISNFPVEEEEKKLNSQDRNFMPPQIDPEIDGGGTPPPKHTHPRIKEEEEEKEEVVVGRHDTLMKYGKRVLLLG